MTDAQEWRIEDGRHGLTGIRVLVSPDDWRWPLCSPMGGANEGTLLDRLNDLQTRLADTEQRLAEMTVDRDRWKQDAEREHHEWPVWMRELQAKLAAVQEEARADNDNWMRATEKLVHDALEVENDLKAKLAEDADWHLAQQHERLTAAQEHVRVLREALVSGCQGCEKRLPVHFQVGSSAAMHFGQDRRNSAAVQTWFHCELSDSQRAALDATRDTGDSK